MYEIFKKLMEEKGVTPYKVSQDTGISQTTLSDWKNGKIVPKMEKLLILSDYFDVDLKYLVGQSDVRKESTEIPDSIIEYGNLLHENEVKEALDTITRALKTKKISSREERLLTYFRMLTEDMQNKLLDLTEATAKNTNKEASK